MRIVHAIARLNVGGASLAVLERSRPAAPRARRPRRGRSISPGEASMEYLISEFDVPYLKVHDL